MMDDVLLKWCEYVGLDPGLFEVRRMVTIDPSELKELVKRVRRDEKETILMKIEHNRKKHRGL